MKFLVAFIVFICLAFPAFSQSAASERFRALSDTMGRTISNSNTRLENYNQDASDSENMRTFTSFRRRHEALAGALRDSEMRMDKYLRTNERADRVVQERNNYESLIKQVEELKNEYDAWLRNVR